MEHRRADDERISEILAHIKSTSEQDKAASLAAGVAAEAAAVARNVADQAIQTATKVAEVANRTAESLLLFGKDVSFIKTDIAEIKSMLEAKYVTKEKYDPLEKSVDGLTGKTDSLQKLVYVGLGLTLAIELVVKIWPSK